MVEENGARVIEEVTEEVEVEEDMEGDTAEVVTVVVGTEATAAAEVDTGEDHLEEDEIVDHPVEARHRPGVLRQRAQCLSKSERSSAPCGIQGPHSSRASAPWPPR